MSPPPLLELTGLTRDYRRGTRALDGVDLTIEAGTILGLVGESGSGKSTLARLVMALDRPTAGAVRFDGEDLFALSARALTARRRGFQMVFQDPVGALDPRQRIGRIVAEPLHLIRPRPSGAERARRVAGALTAVGLDPTAADRVPHQFSGGQRQRIAIARALITRPKLLVADEAVSALDLSVQAQILNLLLDLRDAHGIAILFITHDLAVVEAIADRVAVLYRGRLIESGPAARVLSAPDHPYTRRLLAATPSRQFPEIVP